MVIPKGSTSVFLSDTTWNYLGKCIFSNSVICADLVPVHVPALCTGTKMNVIQTRQCPQPSMFTKQLQSAANLLRYFEEKHTLP